MNTTILRREWFSNVRGDILAGAVVALALIPEAIAFSIIAGVDPKVGLYASFSMAVVRVHPSFASLKLRTAHSGRRNGAGELEGRFLTSTVRRKV